MNELKLGELGSLSLRGTVEVSEQSDLYERTWEAQNLLTTYKHVAYSVKFVTFFSWL